jgi:hypothetical protein
VFMGFPPLRPAFRRLDDCCYGARGKSVAAVGKIMAQR